MAKLEPYSKKLPYSYTLGVFPSLMLLEAHPERAMRLLVHSDGEKNEGVQKLRERCAALGVREEIADRVLKRESKKDNCFAGLVFEKYEIDPSPTECHAVLCQISDSGNAGTALRSLIGFGIHDVALVRPCVDVFDPHVLRASMGRVFQNARAHIRYVRRLPRSVSGSAAVPIHARRREDIKRGGGAGGKAVFAGIRKRSIRASDALFIARAERVHPAERRDRFAESRGRGFCRRLYFFAWRKKQ